MSSIKNEQHLRFTEAALAASDDCIKIIGLDGSLQYMSEGGQRVMEVDDFDALKGCPWPDFWQGMGHTDALDALEKARGGKTARFVGYADTAKGNPRYWDVKVSPILAADGTVESILSISRDITALKEHEERQALLRGELSHRIKNILALVQAVANQTLKSDGDIAAVKAAFLARLAALGRAHDILTQSKTSEVKTSIHAVLKTAASDQLTGRIVLDGPHVPLSSKSGLALALALHELATNAAKYGALSTSEGLVNISWTIRNIEGEDRVKLDWKESDGPRVVAPTRKGFGSKMIERALASYVRGSVNAHYLPEGLHFHLEAPLSALAEE